MTKVEVQQEADEKEAKNKWAIKKMELQRLEDELKKDKETAQCSRMKKKFLEKEAEKLKKFDDRMAQVKRDLLAGKAARKVAEEEVLRL